MLADCNCFFFSHLKNLDIYLTNFCFALLDLHFWISSLKFAFSLVRSRMLQHMIESSLNSLCDLNYCLFDLFFFCFFCLADRDRDKEE